MTIHHCTVIVGVGVACGAPAVATFTTKAGATYYECAAHAPAGAAMPVAAPAHPPTRTTAPFVLVAAGRIVGYAHGVGPAVVKRAAKLGAAIVPVAR